MKELKAKVTVVVGGMAGSEGKGKDLSLIEKVKYSSPTLVAKVVDPQLVDSDQKKIK